MKMDDSDYIKLSSGKRYAFGQVIGISIDANQKNDTIYYGHDGYVGEFENMLTIEDKKEIARIMINRWASFLGALS